MPIVNNDSGGVGDGGLCIANAITAAYQVLNEEATPSEMICEEQQIKRKLEEIDAPEDISGKLRIPDSQATFMSSGSNLSQDEQDTQNIGESMNTESQKASQESVLSNRQKYYNSCLQNAYCPEDKGPFILYVENLDMQVRVHPMSIGKMIRDNCINIYKQIFSIHKIDKYKTKIVISNYKAANELKVKSFFRENNFICYIPNFMIMRQGLVRNIDYSLSDSDIVEFIVSNQEVVKARRIFTKKNNQLVPTPLVVISFKGQSLPPEVKILGVFCRVELFIERVKQCRRCFFFGHYEAACKNEKEICMKCAQAHNFQSCPSTFLQCVNCKGAHMATDKDCPEFVFQKTIKQTMGEKNISFIEAKKFLINKYLYSNRVANVDSNEHFPPLNPSPLHAVQAINPVRESSSASHFNPIPMLDPSTTAKASPRQRIHEKIRVSRRSHPYRNVNTIPQFPATQNISNLINFPNGPITTSQTYAKNIEVNTLRSLFSSVLSKILEKEIPVNRELLSSENNNLDLLIQDSINNMNSTGGFL